MKIFGLIILVLVFLSINIFYDFTIMFSAFIVLLIALLFYKFQNFKKDFIKLNENYNILLSNQKLNQKIQPNKRRNIPLHVLNKQAKSLCISTNNIQNEKTLQQKNEKIINKSQNIGTFVNRSRFNFEFLNKFNLITKIGSLILFIGLAFLAKIAIDQGFLTIKLVLVCIALIGIFLIYLGLRQKEKFGLILQGSGFGIFYLDVYASAKFFYLFSENLGFILMLICIVFSCIFAIRQNSFYLALFSVVFGFLTPILLLNGRDSFYMIFSYYTFLSIAILLINMYKKWDKLAIVGFVFCVFMGLLCGLFYCKNIYHVQIEAFLIILFLLYSFMGFWLYRLNGMNLVLIFGVACVYFVMQNNLLHLNLSLNAILMGILYGIYAYFSKQKIVQFSYISLSIASVSFILMYEFSSAYTYIIYAFEASAISYISCMRKNQTSKIIGLLLLIVASVFLFLADVLDGVISGKIFHIFTLEKPTYLHYILLSIFWLFHSYTYAKFKKILTKDEKVMTHFFALIAFIFCVFGGILNINEHQYQLLFFTLVVFFLGILSYKINWYNMQKYMQYLLIILFIAIFTNAFYLQYPLNKYGIWLTPLMIFVYYASLLVNKIINIFAYKALMYVGLSVLLGMELSKFTSYMHTSLYVAFMPIFIYIFAVINYKFNLYKPYNEMIKNIYAYVLFVYYILAFCLSSDEYMYLPILNALEIMQILSIVYIYLRVNEKFKHFVVLFAILSLGTFMIARGVHYYLDVPYLVENILKSKTFQTSISVFYTIISLVFILVAKKIISRKLWLAGAFVLAFVILKLFFVELYQSGSLQRVVSFVVVGVLMLGIGFMAPMPPKKD